MGGLDDVNWMFSVGATVGILKTLVLHKKPNVLISDFNMEWIEQSKQSSI